MDGFVAKNRWISGKISDEKGLRRQKREFSASKRRRERVSSPKNGVSRAKMTTRKGLVAKKWDFLAQNDDEKGPRRQKRKFSASKRRRERVSSPKNGVSRAKMMTRKGLVAKKGSFPLQKDDEKGSRRQKREFSASKRRRERVSSPKSGISWLKKTTRKGLVAKKGSFPLQKDDEKGSRRQKMGFPGQK
ncbi:hypothetical protein NST89_08815 [Caldifermentibacillus hisashii]|uniref:hypothetical protein n=1 Tax=Caldifermentibacillus hisashii TaxID=996558 RepID=UPI0031361A82